MRLVSGTHGIKSLLRCLQWDHQFSCSYVGAMSMAHSKELGKELDLLLLVAVCKALSHHSGAYSCQNSGRRNYPSLNCVRSQSSTTPSKTSSHISHIPMAHSITAFRLQLLHPPTFRSPRRPQVSQPGSATALLSQQLTQLLLAQLLVLSNYLEHLSSAQSHMGMLNQELLNCFPLFNIDVP